MNSEFLKIETTTRKAFTIHHQLRKLNNFSSPKEDFITNVLLCPYRGNSHITT